MQVRCLISGFYAVLEYVHYNEKANNKVLYPASLQKNAVLKFANWNLMGANEHDIFQNWFRKVDCGLRGKRH